MDDLFGGGVDTASDRATLEEKHIYLIHYTDKYGDDTIAFTEEFKFKKTIVTIDDYNELSISFCSGKSIDVKITGIMYLRKEIYIDGVQYTFYGGGRN